MAELLLSKCANGLESLLVLLLRDLNGVQFEIDKIVLSDFDRVNGLLQLQSSPQGVKLGRDTMAAFQQVLAHRRDSEPGAFVDETGRRLTGPEITQVLGDVARRAGLSFDGSKFRGAVAEAKGQRLVSKGASRDLFYLYGIVSHPLRRQIVELLGDEGPIGFTQIKKRLDVRVGTLYYHFDMLKGLVTQDGEKRYLLTEAGRDAYEKIRSAEYVESSDRLVESFPAAQTSVQRGLRFLAPGVFLSGVQGLRLPSVLGAVVVLCLGAVSVYFAGLETVVFFLNPSGLTPALLSAWFLGNWLLVFGVSDIVATFLFKRRGEHAVFLVGSAYAQVPLLVFMLWWSLAGVFSPQLPGLSTVAVSRIVLLAVQAWSLVLMARIVSVLKGLRLDKAAVVSMVLAYLSIAIAYVRGV